MNRFQKRAAAAIERKGEGGGTHQNQSFAQAVSNANRDALKPFIVECVSELDALIRQDLARQYIEALAPIQTRLMVLERIVMERLGETGDSLARRVLDVEDEATGHVATEEPAERGDLLRVTSRLRLEGQEQWSNPMKLCINRLAEVRPNPESDQLVYQTYESLEQALIGAKVGETRSVVVEVGSENAKLPYTFEVTVDRVSRNVHDRAFQAARAAAQASEVSNG